MESTDCGYLCPYEKGSQKISVCDEIMNMKSDSFKVDMEPFSHLTNKDLSFNSRFNLQRSSLRKGSQLGDDKKMNNPIVDDERDVISSPKGGAMIEKLSPTIVAANEPQMHHQISIITAGAAAITTTNNSGTPTKSKLVGKRSSSFKQSSIVNPRRIMFFFATLSSMGTILLIYFTLSIAKHNGDDNLLD